MLEEFEMWCDSINMVNDHDKALALMAWNACYKRYFNQMALLQHELMQTRHELAACETTLREERKERAK